MIRLLTIALISIISLIASASHAQSINGVKNLGTLRMDEVVFPGSHNSGAGFRDGLKQSSGIWCSRGFYRNQVHSYTKQLELGARYFDIDTMWLPSGQNTGEWWGGNNSGGAWTGHGKCYAGRIQTVIDQIANWMNKKANRNEVVVVHFNGNVRNHHTQDDFKLIWKDINTIFEKRFNTTATDKVGLGAKNKEDKSAGVEAAWPALSTAINSNKRIFLLIDKALRSKAKRKDFLYSNSYRVNKSKLKNAFTGDGVSTKAGTKRVLLENAKKADSDLEFVAMSLITSYGYHIGDLVKDTVLYHKLAVDKANENRKKHSKVVNFISVDRIGGQGEGNGENNVFKIARQLNLEKVEVRVAELKAKNQKRKEDATKTEAKKREKTLKQAQSNRKKQSVFTSKKSVYRVTKDAAIWGYNDGRYKNYSLDQCVQACDSERSFRCLSFDYSEKNKTCDLSKMSVLGLKMINKSSNFVRGGEAKGVYNFYARVFDIKRNAAISGHNDKRLYEKTVEQCAEACMTDRSVECRSFDFHKNKGSSEKCMGRFRLIS